LGTGPSAGITNSLTFSCGSFGPTGPETYYFGDIPDTGGATGQSARTEVMSSFGPGRITSVNIMNSANVPYPPNGPTGASFNIINNTTTPGGSGTQITNTYSFLTSSLLNFPVTPPLPVNLNDTLTISCTFPETAAIPTGLKMRVVATITLP
jgi:hypothetical protein